ncbi:hypothetical protein OO012_06820 [Rhodobacteraceae bacterium KMM 6894]|nr:hypothetical protein [Rhodobacteraceae bacterium KMM 6894]
MFGRICITNLAVLFLVLCLAAPMVSAENRAVDQRAGLMWNRSGLPAVFPLQVKTRVGQDYVMTLTDVTTDQPALAAYIQGGTFFKVLVPPGTFRLSFASGVVWHGEDKLFGPGSKTQHFDLPDPLIFETRGIGTKAGHIVSLLERSPGQMAAITLKDQLICQYFPMTLPDSRIYGLGGQTAQDFLRKPDVDWTWGGPLADPEADYFETARDRARLDRQVKGPRRDLQSQYCG